MKWQTVLFSPLAGLSLLRENKDSKEKEWLSFSNHSLEKWWQFMEF